MSTLPPNPDIDQLRRLAKEHLRRARQSDAEALQWFAQDGLGLTLAAAQFRLARDHGFTSWNELRVEVARRVVLDLRDPNALSAFIARRPELASADLINWMDHPRGASPLGYLAMARYDTATGAWRDVEGTGASAHVLIAAGAPVDGLPTERETPLITAASYGDADVAAVLIAAGATIDAVASHDAGGVPGGSALLHAAVFGMTEVLDVLVVAGARVRSLEEAAAAGDVSAWPIESIDVQTKLRALIMAAHHGRIGVIDTLIAAGTPFDVEDEAFRRHPLRLAASAGRVGSVTALLAHGADPTQRDAAGLTALDHCRHGRANAVDTAGHDQVEALLQSINTGS